MSPRPTVRHRPTREPSGRRVEARVRWFDQIQGVGICAVAGVGQAQVHYRELGAGAYRALDAGDRITCWIEMTEEGAVARDVCLVASLPRE